jgi:transposase
MEAFMITYFHGVDKHSTHLTLTKVDTSCAVISHNKRCEDFDTFINSLSEQDAVAIEAGNMSFALADRMEQQGATVLVIDPRKFKIIASSTKKTDKNDSIALAYSLRNYLCGETFAALPAVYKPSKEIRQLRRMFSAHESIKQMITKTKNTIIGMIRDSGVRLSLNEKTQLFHPKKGMDMLKVLNLESPDEITISNLLELLYAHTKHSTDMRKMIIQYGGNLFTDEVEILLSIHGVSPFLALGFLADIGGDLSRFKSIRGLNAYLGLVPVTRSSGKKEFQGHIIRSSRHLTRTLFTQAVSHIGKSSSGITEWYAQVRQRRGIGRGRIALIRKIVKIMRRMLLDKELYRDVKSSSYEIKLKQFHRILSNGEFFIETA